VRRASTTLKTRATLPARPHQLKLGWLIFMSRRFKMTGILCSFSQLARQIFILLAERAYLRLKFIALGLDFQNPRLQFRVLALQCARGKKMLENIEHKFKRA
jgi:hypothetical protein